MNWKNIYGPLWTPFGGLTSPHSQTELGPTEAFSFSEKVASELGIEAS